MKINIKKICVPLCLSAVSILLFTLPTLAQTKQLLKRTTYKTETVEFGVGGTVSVVGAPVGSITIEGWQKNEVEITAEIEVQAETEADLAQLAAISNFTLDATMGRVSIVSVGTHDKSYMKRAAKKFPKNLLAMPFRIDYKIKVPAFSDLEIDGGRGDFDLSRVEGAMRINFLDTNAKLKFIGGAIVATFGSGNVDMEILARSWRGSGADIQLVKGTMNVTLPQNLNADLDATVLRTGKIENAYATLKQRDRTKFTEKLINAKAGNGGAKLAFTVGDGDLRIAAIKNQTSGQ
jgi:hypothetical protein